MRTLLLVGSIVASSVASPRLLLAQSTAPPSEIVVTGTGEARVTPDRATIVVGVQSRAATAAAAASENARRIRAVLDTLKALGIPHEQMSTANYNVSPEMQYPTAGNQTPRVTGYVVTNSVWADRLQIDEIGRAVDAALARGANEISSLRLYSSKADSARRSALSAAVVDARAQAEVLARAAGGSLGPLILLSSAQEPIRPLAQPMMSAARSVGTSIQAGEQTVTATVTARWTFVGGR
jgi:uncharacterized protein